jgi:hypothetical protein
MTPTPTVSHAPKKNRLVMALTRLKATAMAAIGAGDRPDLAGAETLAQT